MQGPLLSLMLQFPGTQQNKNLLQPSDNIQSKRQPHPIPGKDKSFCDPSLGRGSVERSLALLG